MTMTSVVRKNLTNVMGLFPKTNLLVFCAYLFCIEKRNNFVEEKISIQAFFL
jgi:hypothetical protein